MTKELIKKYISLIDLTSLSSLDNEQSIKRLIEKGNSGLEGVQPAAFCIFSTHIKQLLQSRSTTIKCATVAGYFPSGQSTLEQKMNELNSLIATDVDEIDIVINRGNVIAGDYNYLAKEIKLSKEIVGDKCLKVILETGELNAQQIQKSSEVAISSGADFIKTSTGKSSTGATIEAAEIMCGAIKTSNKNVGIKISGGVRTFDDAHAYASLIKDILSEDWIRKDRFRIGASSLFDQLIIDYNSL